MLIFWVVVALLLAGGLLLLLPSLWSSRATAQVQANGANAAVYRDQLREAERDLAADLITPERFEQLRGEIQRRVLEDAQLAAADAPAPRPARRSALVLALLIPLASIATYLVLGVPEAAAPSATRAASDGGDGRHELGGDQIQQMVAALAERLKSDPGNVDGWLMLARSYTALGRYRDAEAAMRKAVELLPGNADLIADLADVMAMAQGKRLSGEPARLIQQALDIDPNHVKALALAGSVAFEGQEYAHARAYWERLLAGLPADSPMATSVRGSIAEATRLEAGAAAPPAVRAAAPAGAASVAAGPGTGASAGGAPAAAARLAGEVVLSPELAARVAPGDTVFVFARAAQGPRMPLAIVRQPVGSWPLRFVLDDSTAMSPEMRLSAHAQVVVGVRVSRSGNATPQSGDLVGQSAPVAHTAQGLRVVIDRLQP